jgi:FixJ family two-component response regulator
MNATQAGAAPELVYIVDDDASVRDSLSLMLSLEGYATATFASAEDFLKVARPQWRGCAVLDVRMPGLSGLQLQQRMRTQLPELAVVVITAHGDVAAARQAFLAQAVDFIEKPFDAKQIVAAIEKARSRPRPGAAAQGPREVPASVTDKLSEREREVMALMIRGLHNRHIAKELGISPRTVEVHKARVMEKLGARNLVEFVRLVDNAPP